MKKKKKRITSTEIVDKIMPKVYDYLDIGIQDGFLVDKIGIKQLCFFYEEVVFRLGSKNWSLAELEAYQNPIETLSYRVIINILNKIAKNIKYTRGYKVVVCPKERHIIVATENVPNKVKEYKVSSKFSADYAREISDEACKQAAITNMKKVEKKVLERAALGQKCCFILPGEVASNGEDPSTVMQMMAKKLEELGFQARVEPNTLIVIWK